MSFEYLSSPPKPSEYVDVARPGVSVLPHGNLFIGEGLHWQERHARAEAENNEAMRQLSGLINAGLHDLAVGLLAIKAAQSRPLAAMRASAHIAQWYEWCGLTFGNSRLLRATEQFGVARPGAERGRMESGIDVVELPLRPMARIAIHAAADDMDRLGLTPHRRHRVSWYRNQEHGMFVRAENPSSPSPEFRRRYNEINGHAFNSSDAFTLRGYLMTQEWVSNT